MFRAIMALAAAYNLEIRQYDAKNAFTNAKLEQKVFCYPPQGFGDSDSIWLMQRALYEYGLKTSPLLWHRELTKALTELGLKPIPGVNCLFRNEKLIVFFYVDDIVVLSKTKDIP